MGCRLRARKPELFTLLIVQPHPYTISRLQCMKSPHARPSVVPWTQKYVVEYEFCETSRRRVLLDSCWLIILHSFVRVRTTTHRSLVRVVLLLYLCVCVVRCFYYWVAQSELRRRKSQERRAKVEPSRKRKRRKQRSSLLWQCRTVYE